MLVSIEDVADDVRLGIWSFSLNKEMSPRENERMAVRLLLVSMLGYPDFEVKHDSSGKPHLEGYNISISHTRGYVAVMLSKKYNVGVDIEYQSERVNRIASRFMRVDEKADNTVMRLVNWCAKEAVYKLFSEDNLTYQHMRVVIGTDGCVVVENLKRQVSVCADYRILPEYVLVYCLGHF